MTATNTTMDSADIQHVFIIGSKSIGQYGGYETFVERLLSVHENDASIRYHVACKANGEGYMDETKLSPIHILKKTENGSVEEFEYKNAHVFKISCPDIGAAVALYYDRKAVKYSIQYCIDHHIEHPVFYILTCRIGLFICSLTKRIKGIGGKLYLNPDGHEWKRTKWPAPVRQYWKWSEKKMVKCADLVVCDSVNIETYIQKEYGIQNTTYIAYGADAGFSELSDDDSRISGWLEKKNLERDQYYLIVGRFVPENNYEAILREFIKSRSTKALAIITKTHDKYLNKLNKRLNFRKDPRIRFVGTVYDQDLLKKIRECAYGYIHGHEVGGTNPSLLEAMGSTELNLLLDVGFNREVGQNAVLYWTKTEGDLCSLIQKADQMTERERKRMGNAARERIRSAYSWEYIGQQYKKIWTR